MNMVKEILFILSEFACFTGWHNKACTGAATFSAIPRLTWIVRKAREQGLAGATVLRGLVGFGAHSRLHTAKILRLSSDLPIVVEIVDTEEKIESFLPLIDDVIVEGLATVERVDVRLYRSGRSES